MGQSITWVKTIHTEISKKKAVIYSCWHVKQCFHLSSHRIMIKRTAAIFFGCGALYISLQTELQMRGLALIFQMFDNISVTRCELNLNIGQNIFVIKRRQFFNKVTYISKESFLSKICIYTQGKITQNYHSNMTHNGLCVLGVILIVIIIIIPI